MADCAVPVTIVTGFLGAGKSTLLQRWLSELPREETAVIVNERGEIGIDGELLAAHVARLREITGGCVCCTSQAELLSALSELSESTPAPTRILVETSGAASPAGVIRALSAGRARERLRLDGVVTVIDATRAQRALAFDVAAEQLGFADVVVLSHVDRAEAQSLDLAAVERELVQYAPAAATARARRGTMDWSFLELLARRVDVLHSVADGSGHSVIEAISLRVEGALDEERFGNWMETALGGVEARILRIKGIVAIEGVSARVVVQGVGEAVEVQLGGAWGQSERVSRLVVLGLGLDALALKQGFAACAADDAAASAPG